jgi:MoaA/NifB/PqqE/SkfB family radical SAM enzyme
MNCCFVPLKNGIRLQWDITNRCNLKCIHCCASKEEVEEPTTVEYIDRVVDILAKNDVMKVTISGGEPTLNKMLYYIVSKLKEAGIKVGIVTNLYYDYTLIEPLIDKLDSITTSIDGPADIHNNIRGQNCYDTILRNILRIIRVKNVKVITTLSKLNYGHIEETVSCLAGIGVKNIMCAYITPRGKGALNKEMLELQIDKNKIENQIQRLSEKYGVNISSSVCSHYFKSLDNQCLAANKIFYLSASGTLHPCHLYTEYGISIFEDQCFDLVRNWYHNSHILGEEVKS